MKVAKNLMISFLLVPLASSVQAALILNFTEITGGTVSYSGTGSLNFGGMQASDTGILISTLEGAGINPAAGSFVNSGFGSTPPPPTANKYTGITGPTSLGSGAKTGGPSFGYGFWFFPSAGELYIGSSYTSGSPLNISGMYPGKTIGTLGLTPGTYTWTLGTGAQSDTLTMNVVPEPSSFALLGFAAAGLLVRRKR